MDFQFTEDQQAIAELAGQIFRDQVDDDYHRGREPGADRALWKLLADSGLTAACVDEQAGGSGMGMMELALMLEAQGRSLAPVPLAISSIAAQALARFGDASQQQQWLPGVVDGSHWLSIALTEVAADSPAPFRLRQGADGWVVDGVADQVTWAEGAAAVLVPARTEGGETDTWLVMPVTAGGVSLESQRATHPEPRYRLSADGVALPATAALDSAGTDISGWLLARTRLAIAAMALGVAEEALQRTAAYTMERTQFGKPLAAFQAVAHRAAEGYVDCEALRTVIWSAAWRLDAGQSDADADTMTAKWWAAEVGHRLGHTAQHLHGGMGSDVDYPIHRFYLWAKGLEFSLGGAGRQLSSLGRRLASDSGLGARL